MGVMGTYFCIFLSPEEYGETHPEYFSFYDGKRHAGMVPSWDGKSEQPEAQLCLTNPDVLEIVCQNLQAQIDRNLSMHYIGQSARMIMYIIVSARHASTWMKNMPHLLPVVKCMAPMSIHYIARLGWDL